MNVIREINLAAAGDHAQLHEAPANALELVLAFLVPPNETSITLSADDRALVKATRVSKHWREVLRSNANSGSDLWTRVEAIRRAVTSIYQTCLSAICFRLV